MAANHRIARVVGAVNIGSVRVSALIAVITEEGEVQVLGSGYRASQGVNRGYVVDHEQATHAVRDALERAEKMAGTSVDSVWIGCSGAGLASEIRPVEIGIGGRRVEEEDIEALLVAAHDNLEPDGRTVLHAQPACYFLDGAHGVANPRGLHADRLGVDVHVMLADGAPVRNVRQAVQSAHLEVDDVVASPLATGYACLTEEERDLGVALVELGGEVTNVSVFAGGMLVGLTAIERGGEDITDAIASGLSIRRQQAERLKCVAGSAIASPTDHREMIEVAPPSQESATQRGAVQQVPRAELIGVITGELDLLMSDVAKALDAMGFSGGSPGSSARQVVVTGGGAELAGIADYAQGVLGVPVRIGKPVALKGLPEAHSAPGFSTLVGLALYAANDPIDIRDVSARFTRTMSYGPLDGVMRIWTAMREYF
ncbi:cell division protein FtsA [Aurantiacibacter poecillastricola]|uniref:cell division protein FtsA n=1 Tax=Aurantiacibacter poecillastricola TaxID=3064385 RepID=UPI00273E7589|nr:cell division protein FtsA [Aurantiacibacter sp. 219JJ12-13]MDP5262890.1 cell division protein FtsA [Aurantiacibacter sp. 219JJ12-13]